MMNWKTRKETLNIGSLELDSLTFNEEYIQISLDIFHMSGELQAEIDKAVETEKVDCLAGWQKFYSEYPNHKKYFTEWSSEPIVMDYNYLRVVLEGDKPVSYSIVTGFHDAVNEYMKSDAEIQVDLSEYEEDLKKAVMKAMIDKFF